MKRYEICYVTPLRWSCLYRIKSRSQMHESTSCGNNKTIMKSGHCWYDVFCFLWGDKCGFKIALRDLMLSFLLIGFPLLSLLEATRRSFRQMCFNIMMHMSHLQQVELDSHCLTMLIVTYILQVSITQIVENSLHLQCIFCVLITLN